MEKKIIYICDICGCEKICNDQKESIYRKVKFFTGKENNEYIEISYTNLTNTDNEKLICETCQIKLGIQNVDLKTETNFDKQPESIDKIFEVFESMADELGYIKEK